MCKIALRSFLNLFIQRYFTNCHAGASSHLKALEEEKIKTTSKYIS